MRIKLYALFFLLSAFTIKAQGPWVIADTMGFTWMGNTKTSNLISFGPNIYATSGMFSSNLYTSGSGNPGTWSIASTAGLPCCSQFTHDKVGKTLDGGGYLYLGGWYGPNTDGQVYSSTDGQNWNLYLNTHVSTVHDITAYKGNGATDSTYIASGSQVWKGAINANDPYNASNSWRIACDFDSVPGAADWGTAICSAIHNGKLYYGLSKGGGPSAQIVQTSDGIIFTVDTMFRTVAGYDTFYNDEISAMESYAGYLYIAFTNSTHGTQIMRSNDDVNWQLVKVDSGYVRVTDFEVAGGALYAAYEEITGNGSGKIEKTTNGTTFTASTPDLFGVAGNYGGLGKFTIYNNSLYFGSENYLGGGSKVISGSAGGVGPGGHAGQVWRLCLAGPAPIINFTNNNASACNGTLFNAIVSPGFPSYSWNTGSTTMGGSLSVPGNYMLTVTDANGCANTAPFNISGLQPPADPVITTSGIFCRDSAIVLTPQDGDQADFYALNLPGSGGYSMYSGDLTTILAPTDSVTETIEFWVKPFTAGIVLIEGSDQYLSGWADSQAEIVNDSMMVRVWNSSPINLGHVNYGSWYHVAYSYNKTDSTLRGYLNGTLKGSVDSVARQTPIANGVGTVYLFGDYTPTNLGSSAVSHAHVRDFRLWTTERTGTEISTNMNASFAPGTPNLALYYKMNEGSGSGVVHDSSGNAINGNMYSGPSFVAPPVSFTWSPSTFLSGTSGVVTCIADTSITYTLTVTAMNGCTATTAQPITLGKVLFNKPSSICYPDTSTNVWLNNGNPIGVDWWPNTYISDTAGTNIILDPPASTTYYVSFMDMGCPLYDSIRIQVSDFSSVALSPSTPNLCYADSMTFSTVQTGGTAPYTYSWGTTWGGPPSTNPTYGSGSVTNTFSTTVYCNVTDAAGCAHFNTTNINLMTSTSLIGNITKQTGGLVTSGYVYLFKHQPGSAALDSIFPISAISGTGDYSYTGVNSGDYLIKAIADTLTYPDAWSTYYGNEYIWDSSLIYHHGCAQIDTANITVIEVVPMTGNGIVSGYVLEGPGFGQKLIGGPDHIMVPGGPIRGVDVKLGKNPGGSAAARTFTDTNGFYQFVNVDPGTYRIYVDIPNLPMDSTRQVAITALDTSVHNDYFVDSTMIYVVDTTATVGIYSSTVKNTDNFSIYPNPAKGLANLCYELAENAQVTLEVYSTIGEKIMGIYSGKQQPGKFSYPLDVKALNMRGGVYIVSLRINNKVSTQRVVIIE